LSLSARSMTDEPTLRAWRLADLDPPAARSAALQTLDPCAPDGVEAARARWHRCSWS
jgi:hypothetical protein